MVEPVILWEEHLIQEKTLFRNILASQGLKENVGKITAFCYLKKRTITAVRKKWLTYSAIAK